MRKDHQSGEVDPVEKRLRWNELFAARDPSDPETASFMSDREDPPPQEQELF